MEGLRGTLNIQHYDEIILLSILSDCPSERLAEKTLHREATINVRETELKLFLKKILSVRGVVHRTRNTHKYDNFPINAGETTVKLLHSLFLKFSN